MSDLSFTVHQKDDQGNTIYEEVVVNGKTKKVPKIDQEKTTTVNDWSDNFARIKASNLIYDRGEIEWYEKFNRFGCLDPYNKLTYAREYLFFTKPDCNILVPKRNSILLQPAFSNNPFFIDCANRYPHVLQMLQRSAGNLGLGSSGITKTPFMPILSNSVKSTIDLQALSAEQMDGPANIYGTSISYRKDAWKGDENIEFSLEVEDTKYFEIYMLLKAYEEYERVKNMGLVYPVNDNYSEVDPNDTSTIQYNSYIANKELHDTFGIYRFIVGEDLTEILYWSYICGAYFNNVPRDAFNDLKNGDGLNYSIEFKAFCVIDMDPMILSNFNNLIQDSGFSIKTEGDADLADLENNNSTRTYLLPIVGTHDSTLQDDMYDTVNPTWASFPYVQVVQNPNANLGSSSNAWQSSQSMAYKYELVWAVEEKN